MVGRPVQTIGIRQAVVGLLALLLVFGHDLAGPLSLAGDDAPLWRASDICSTGGLETPSPAEPQSSEHDSCAFHCALGNLALAPTPATVAVPWVVTAMAVHRLDYSAPAQADRWSANSPRAPPFS
ncbi:MAG: hypothetical protein H7Y60_05820 [Rhodospirillaceae bacterium]|nr:hypothetical protein [Rhodospirillales bacterium]